MIHMGSPTDCGNGHSDVSQWYDSFKHSLVWVRLEKVRDFDSNEASSFIPALSRIASPPEDKIIRGNFMRCLKHFSHHFHYMLGSLRIRRSKRTFTKAAHSYWPHESVRWRWNSLKRWGKGREQEKEKRTTRRLQENCNYYSFIVIDTIYMSLKSS